MTIESLSTAALSVLHETQKRLSDHDDALFLTSSAVERLMRPYTNSPYQLAVELGKFGYLTSTPDGIWITPPKDLPPARPSWDQTGIDLAKVFAARSADHKVAVGAVILSNESRTLISGGLNGRYPGCPVETRADDRQGCSEMLHAEQQAVARARWEPGEKATLYTTTEPCHECALLILAARHINRVVFESEYAGDGVRRRGSEILRDAGVEVVQWQE